MAAVSTAAIEKSAERPFSPATFIAFGCYQVA
jgi:hypothetical protein